MITELSQLDFSKTYDYQDYLTWRFKEQVELIKGKLMRMSPAPNREHQRISRRLSGLFFNYFEPQPGCEFFTAPFDVRLPGKGERVPSTVVQPDLCVICDTSKLDEQGCVGAPDWVIEILSPGNSRKEMKEKFELYQEAGVREYWLVHPMDKAVFVYVRNEEGKFSGLPPFIAPQQISPVIFPGLSISLGDVFADE